VTVRISAPAFGWWKRQLQGRPRPRRRLPAAKRSELGNPTEVRFAEVQRRSPAETDGSPATYEVLLSRGRAIRVGHTFDPEVLKCLITTVEASC
jgi:hypothetical protein